MVQPDQYDATSIRKRTGAVDSLICYEITEDELDALVKGSPSSTLKDVGIAALSAGLSFFGSLLGVSCDPTGCQKFSVLLALTIAGCAIGVVFLLVYQRTKISLAPLLDRIRNRISLTTAESLGPPAISVAPANQAKTEDEQKPLANPA